MIYNVLLLQLDGKLPNLALMRLSTYHKQQGATVYFGRRPEEVFNLYVPFDQVYASCLFEKTRPKVRALLERRHNAVVGGPGWSEVTNLEDLGVPAATPPDYDLYPAFTASLGYTQRGCRLKCPFCKVPRMEGRVIEQATVRQIWRGPGHPRHIHLLDNDFFGQPHWRDRLREMRDGYFEVCFNQGINVRILSEEQARAIARVEYRDDQFGCKRLYTAWDNYRDDRPLFRGLDRLVAAGVRPDEIMVYMLIGYWHGPRLHDDDFARHSALRAYGCRPYPMPYVRTRELVGFQRWIIGAYDKRIPWADWKRAGYEPRKIVTDDPLLDPLVVEEKEVPPS
jgi:hypothetical protein